MYGVVANYVCMSNCQLCYSPSTYLQTSVLESVQLHLCMHFNLHKNKYHTAINYYVTRGENV